MRDNTPDDVEVGAYIGWLEGNEMEQLVINVDRLYIHAYRTDPSAALGYMKSRLEMMADLQRPLAKENRVKVFPIYSAEWRRADVCDAGRGNPEFNNQMCFMGKYYRTNSIQTSENVLLADLEKTYKPLWKLSPTEKSWKYFGEFSGFAYFAYSFLKNELPETCN